MPISVPNLQQTKGLITHQWRSQPKISGESKTLLGLPSDTHMIWQRGGGQPEEWG